MKEFEYGVTAWDVIKDCFMTQKYSCCALISAINARVFLDGEYDANKKIVSDEEFERLVDLVGCRHGVAICVGKSYPELELEAVDGPYFDLEWIEYNLPVEVSVSDVGHERYAGYGFHSVLIVGIEHDKRFNRTSVFVANFDKVGVQFSWKDFCEFKVDSPNPLNKKCRSFKLVGGGLNRDVCYRCTQGMAFESKVVYDSKFDHNWMRKQVWCPAASAMTKTGCFGPVKISTKAKPPEHCGFHLEHVVSKVEVEDG